MDLGSAIIGAIILAICIIPIILMGQSRKKEERKTLQSLINIANQQHCNISKHEICGDFIIGIDETKKQVFFIKNTKDQVIEQSIKLIEIQSCKLINETRKNSNPNVINKLELLFIPIDKNKKEITLEFYNRAINTQLDGEVQSLEKWWKLIQDNLKVN